MIDKVSRSVSFYDNGVKLVRVLGWMLRSVPVSARVALARRPDGIDRSPALVVGQLSPTENSGMRDGPT